MSRSNNRKKYDKNERVTETETNVEHFSWKIRSIFISSQLQSGTKKKHDPKHNYSINKHRALLNPILRLSYAVAIQQIFC